MQDNTFTHDQKKEHLNLAKLKKGGAVFEIQVEPNLAIDYKQGKEIDIKDVLMSQQIFADMKKGLFASEDKMQELFGTIEPLEVAKKIIDNGEIQLTAEFREKLRQEKRKKIINIIHRNAIDPKTGHPHPPNRIEAAIEEAKVKIDEMKSAEEQVEGIIKKLLPIIPIKFDTKKIQLEIKSSYAQQCIGTIKNMSNSVEQTWDNSGSLVATVVIPAGLIEDFFDKLNSITHGTLNSKIIE